MPPSKAVSSHKSGTMPLPARYVQPVPAVRVKNIIAAAAGARCCRAPDCCRHRSGPGVARSLCWSAVVDHQTPDRRGKAAVSCLQSICGSWSDRQTSTPRKPYGVHCADTSLRDSLIGCRCRTPPAATRAAAAATAKTPQAVERVQPKTILPPNPLPSNHDALVPLLAWKLLSHVPSLPDKP